MSNRQNTPKDVVTAKLCVERIISSYSNGTMIEKWKDRRDVTYISSEFPNDMVRITKRRDNKKFETTTTKK